MLQVKWWHSAFTTVLHNSQVSLNSSGSFEISPSFSEGFTNSPAICCIEWHGIGNSDTCFIKKKNISHQVFMVPFFLKEEMCFSS